MATYSDVAVNIATASGAGTVYTVPAGRWARISVRVLEPTTGEGFALAAGGVVASSVANLAGASTFASEVILDEGQSVSYQLGTGGASGGGVSLTAVEYAKPN